MQPVKKNINIYFVFIACWLLLLTITSFKTPPSFFSDSGYGFLAMDNYQHGGAFNTLATPSTDNDAAQISAANISDANNDIAKISTGYLSWWSPGQWVIPWLFLFLHVKLGSAIVLAVAISSLLGIIGYYKLFRLLNFTEVISILAVCLICVCRYFILPFQIYNGGEVLQFGGVPWLLILCYTKKNTVVDFLLIASAVIIAYFLKSSAIVCIASFTVAARYFQSGGTGRQFRINNFFSIIVPGIAVLAGYLMCKLLFVHGGFTPMSNGNSIGSIFTIKNLTGICFIIAGPLTSIIGIDDYYNYFLQSPAHRVLPDNSIITLLFYAALAFVFLAISFYTINSKKADRLRMPIIFVCCGYVAFLMFGFLTGRPVSADTETRHFRMAGTLLAPFILEFLFNRFSIKVVYGGVIALIIVLGGYAALSHLKKVREQPVVVSGDLGFRHTIIDSEALTFISSHKNENITWYLTSPEIALEVPNGKAIVNHDDFEDLKAIQNRKIKGRVSKLCIVLPNTFKENGKMQAVINSFKDYKPEEFNYSALSKFTIISYGL